MAEAGAPNNIVQPSTAYFGGLGAGAAEGRSYGSWNTIYRRFRRWSEAAVSKTVAVTLVEIMANSFLGMVHLATVRYWLKFVHAAAQA